MNTVNYQIIKDLHCSFVKVTLTNNYTKFKMYNLKNFGISVHPWNYYYNEDSEHIHDLTNFIAFLDKPSLLSLPMPDPSQLLICFLLL